MSSGIQVVHDGVTITYDEIANDWKFELRGRSRSSVSLLKAKEAIDAPPPAKEKPFQRIAAYYFGYDGEVKQLEVTSIAEESSWSRSRQVWTTDSSKQRNKRYAHELFLVTPENDAILAEIKQLQVDQKELRQREQQKRTTLKTVDSVITTPTESL